MEEHFVDGQKEGVQKEYHANGTLKKFDSFTDGQQEGASYRYDATGKLRQKEVFVAGEQQRETMTDNTGNEDWTFDAKSFQNPPPAGTSMRPTGQHRVNPLGDRDTFQAQQK